MKAEFTVYGEPKCKGRPRFTMQGGKPRAVTPKETRDYEDTVKAEYRIQCRGTYFGKGIPLKMTVYAYLGIPKSASKKKRKDMQNGIIRPTKTPDSSNILKAIGDALNGVAYNDDAQIVETRISRAYSKRPHVEVAIEEVAIEEM